LQWIETFRDGEIFWDIGANVGLYSLYAAFKGHAVLAFEPSPTNYHLLCRNIEINQKSQSLSAYCIAFSDHTRLGSLHMASSQIGAALNSFGEVDGLQHGSSSTLWSQATLGFCIDDFIELFDPPFPSHIKIDVDGIEGKIVTGARKTMNDRRLRSVLVELDRKEKIPCNAILDVFKRSSFEWVNEAGFHRPNNRRGFDIYNAIFVRST
jgi:FkbM family methyltransferase